MDDKPFRLIWVTSKLRSELIRQAKRRVIYCGPGISNLEVEALVEVCGRIGKEAVQVMVDLKSETLAAGFWGDSFESAMDKLPALGNSVSQADGLRLGLLIVDDQSVFYTPIAQGIEAEAATLGEPNAVRLNAAETELLLSSILKPKAEAPEPRPTITAEYVNKIKENIAQELIPTPANKRLLGELNRKIRLLQFEVHGIKLNSRRLELPDEVVEILGGDNREFSERLAASWKLFKIGENAELSKLQKSVEQELTQLKKTYLVNLSHYGFGLNTTYEKDFDAAWKEFQSNKVEEFRQALQDKVNEIVDQSKALLSQLIDERINSGQLGVPPSKDIRRQSPDDRRKQYVDELVSTVRWPSADNIAKDLVVSMREYSVSASMLSNEEFRALLEKAFNFKIDELAQSERAEPEKQIEMPSLFSLN